MADFEYKKHFDEEVSAFKQRIKKRAQEKIDEAIAEQEVNYKISCEFSAETDSITVVTYVGRGAQSTARTRWIGSS